MKGLAFDDATLALLDDDNDGRIRAPEVVAASEWCAKMLKSLDALAQRGQPLTLSNIDTSTDEGAAVLASAQQILADSGADDASTIAVAQASAAIASLSKAAFNGDGIIPAAATEDEALQTLIGEIIAGFEGIEDRSGEPGVNQDKVDAFFADAQALSEWTATATDDTRPLGDETAAAADAVVAVKSKIDDFFARCRLAAFDERAIAALNRKEEEYLTIAAEDLSVTADEVVGFPLARVEAGRALPLTDSVNPAWAAALSTLKAAAAGPIIGDGTDSLTEADWNTIQAKLTPFEAWRGSKPATVLGGLSDERIAEVLASNGKEALTELIAKDAAIGPQFDSIGQVERLTRYHRDMFELAHNFVNFKHFYSDDERATFEAGTLYLDGRACELVVRVDDPAKHGKLAAGSKLFLAYCNCTRPSGEKMQIAAAFTDGDSDYLMVGRNGVFYDRDGKDWDATITKIIDNPISLRQAFWAPYKALVKFFEDMAAKRAAAKEAAAKKERLASAQAAAGKPGEAPAAPSIDMGMVAAIAVGLGALGTMAVAMIGYITGLFSLYFWMICLVILGIFIAISLPSVMMAYLKLRQRSLGPVLDSNGWAVNGRAKVSVRFGRTMTHVAKVPKGSKIDNKDKYADPKSPWPRLLLVVVVIMFFYSLVNWTGIIYDLSGGMIGDPAPSEPLIPVTEDEAEAEAEAPAKADAPAKAE